MDHLTLEHEIATELNPFATGVAAGSAPALRRETVLSMLNQAAQLAHDFTELLNEAGFLGAAVMELDSYAGAETRDDKLVVSAGSVADSSDTAISTHEVSDDAKRSAFQFAINSGHPIVIADAQRETRFRDSFLMERGIKSGAVCPINYREQHYGAIGFFSQDCRKLTKDDVLFLQSVALFLGPARAHQKTEKSIAEHTRVLSSAIDSLEAMVLLLSTDGSILQINRACQAVGGFTLAELRGRRIWSAFWKSEEATGAQSVIGELRSGEKQVKREAFFVAKRGAIRRVNWTFARLHDGTSDGPAILATGIDITEQYQSLRKMEEASKGNRSKNGGVNPDNRNATTDTEQGAADTRERRRHDRRPYQCIQMVAPCIDGKLPELDQFRDVRCYDISPGGFSFLLASRPTFDELVAAFGANQSRLYLRAQIKHITPFQFENRKVLLIGCEYVGRVRTPILQD